MFIFVFINYFSETVYKIMENLKFWHICFKSLFSQKYDTDIIKDFV